MSANITIDINGKIFLNWLRPIKDSSTIDDDFDRAANVIETCIG